METYTDERDGNIYKIVRIGNLYWFSENLRYEGVEHYFPNRDSDNLQKYGCLYTWENAIKACPEGWRLPTKDEYSALIVTSDFKMNKSSVIRDISWENGSNTSGFSALPAGERDCSGDFDGFGLSTYFWSFTPKNADNACLLLVCPSYAYVYSDYFDNAFSVRCVKDI